MGWNNLLTYLFTYKTCGAMVEDLGLQHESEGFKSSILQPLYPSQLGLGC
jgi:hypothetical protein